MCLLCSLQVQAFQPCFLFLNLPYTAIRGEEFALAVSRFHYGKVTTEVTYSGLLIPCTSGKTGRDGVLCLAFDTLFLSIGYIAGRLKADVLCQ
jgi:hypothetical protein